MIENSNDLEYNEIVTLYNKIKETILCKKLIFNAAPELVDKLPVVKNYYNKDINN